MFLHQNTSSQLVFGSKEVFIKPAPGPASFFLYHILRWLTLQRKKFANKENRVSLLERGTSLRSDIYRPEITTPDHILFFVISVAKNFGNKETSPTPARKSQARYARILDRDSYTTFRVPGFPCSRIPDHSITPIIFPATISTRSNSRLS